jgi:hypothetical protein
MTERAKDILIVALFVGFILGLLAAVWVVLRLLH